MKYKDIKVGMELIHGEEKVIVTKVFEIFGSSPSGCILVEGEDGVPELVHEIDLEMIK